MYICPVCNKENKTVICGECGFDISRNYECFSTISLPVGAISAIQAQRTTWEKKKYPDCRICSACGGISFRIGKEDARAVCVRCGKEYPLKLKAARDERDKRESAGVTETAAARAVASASCISETSSYCNRRGSYGCFET